MKLTPDQVEVIKKRRASGESRAQLAADYGVHPQTIYQACIGNRTDRRAKLTVDQVRTIKRRLADGEWQFVIAQDLGVAPQIVSLISRGKTWRWVTLDGKANSE